VCNKLFVIFVFITVLCSEISFAGSRLLYLEGQWVAGYSGSEKKAIYYSTDQDAEMQKPSIGFDYVQKFSGRSGDYGTFALQARGAWNNEGPDRFEGQIYNAYYKFKAGWSNIWVGHDRSSFGMTSYFDSHGLLLPTLAMTGYGFERDWGSGINKDLSWGDAGFSLTSGSGMPLFLKGNWLLSSRVSKGVLNRDNYNVGVSVSGGRILNTMGEHLMDPDPHRTVLGGLDTAVLWNNIENRFEFIGGENLGLKSYAFFLRSTAKFMDEDRFKVEFQPVVSRNDDVVTYDLYGGVSFSVTADLCLRMFYLYRDMNYEHRGVAQLYYYFRVL